MIHFHFSKKLLIASLLSLILVAIVSLAPSEGVQAETRCENAEEGFLRNMTGQDGCGWVIQLADSSLLEPTNLRVFAIELQDNKPVCVRYHVIEGAVSACMVGKIVELDFIE